jgi:hypothetical protein
MDGNKYTGDTSDLPLFLHAGEGFLRDEEKSESRRCLIELLEFEAEAQAHVGQDRVRQCPFELPLPYTQEKGFYGMKKKR